MATTEKTRLMPGATRSESNQRLIRQLWSDSFGRRRVGKFRVASGSMVPLIEIGDEVIVSALDDVARIRTGDIILFQPGDGPYVVHRVIGKSKSGGRLYFRQKGDAAVESGVIAAHYVIGRVTEINKEASTIYLGGVWATGASYALGFAGAFLDVFHRGANKVLSHRKKEQARGLDTVSGKISRKAQAVISRFYLLTIRRKIKTLHQENSPDE